MRKFVFGTMIAAILFGCLGGQTKQTREDSARIGDQTRGAPTKARDRDWAKAAQGHGAAGPISPDELARMEKRSAPGGNLARDRDGGGP